VTKPRCVYYKECKKIKTDEERLMYCIKEMHKQTFYGCPYHYRRLRSGIYHWASLLNKEDLETL
jgi:hypothetical protein